ncbi:hypothetical protein [Nonomuraea jabiensis]|uniref:Uncharacterized protein n=1 Tax=Nonomuraea jabiensis TaxID=882448 RepID=A0A7W9FXS4_9ACTN|nr:hypothetical protein [Nonomuraea jabiensis]MBB5773522.1 hypothetical protein [Nonomuraea jabiensis]
MTATAGNTAGTSRASSSPRPTSAGDTSRRPDTRDSRMLDLDTLVFELVEDAERVLPRATGGIEISGVMVSVAEQVWSAPPSKVLAPSSRNSPSARS